MITPQEVQVWYILPALRRQYTLALKNFGKKQKEIASILNITEAAVSQYLKGKRGHEIVFPNSIEKEISKSAKQIVKNSKLINSELQNLIKKVTDTRFICSVCHDHAQTNEDCEVCYG